LASRQSWSPDRPNGREITKNTINGMLSTAKRLQTSAKTGTRHQVRENRHVFSRYLATKSMTKCTKLEEMPHSSHQSMHDPRHTSTTNISIATCVQRVTLTCAYRYRARWSMRPRGLTPAWLIPGGGCASSFKVTITMQPLGVTLIVCQAAVLSR